MKQLLSILAWIAVIWLLLLVSAATLPPLPQAPKNLRKLQSPKHAEQLASWGKAMVRPKTPTNWRLVWDYQTPVPTNILFVVYWSDTMPVTNWQPFGTTTNLEMPLQMTNPAAFFRVTAKDTVTGLESR